MHRNGNQLVFTATDVANHLACAHLTQLQRLVALSELKKPHYEDPFLAMLRERGFAHEKAYVASLGTGDVVDLSGEKNHDPAEAATNAAMERGARVIVQAAVSYDRFRGRPDVLLRVDTPSTRWAWSYQVHDTKLSEHTRAGAILQLCLYWRALQRVQGDAVSHFVIKTPKDTFHYRARDYLAYFDMVAARLIKAADGADATYPEPCPQCEICNWSRRCDEQRRSDDHLHFVANIRAVQRRELVDQGIATLTALADTPAITFKPKRGTRDGYERARLQAEIQKRGERAKKLIHDLLDVEAERGFNLLPARCDGDVFLDFEGDPFALPSGREYLIGIVTHDGGYRARWAIGPNDERSMFEETMRWLTERVAAFPKMHIYHYAPYEQSAFKRLAARYGSCQDELDRLLRGQRFVDLYAVVRQSLRASVESYSIKQIEKLAGFHRAQELPEAGRARRMIELALETGRESSIEDSDKLIVARYNEDDCQATRVVRDWLVQQQVHAQVTPRSEMPLDASEAIAERNRAVDQLRTRLLDGAQSGDARWLLAQLLDFHRREQNVKTWERFAHIDQYLGGDWEELLDDRHAIVGLELLEQCGASTTGIPQHRYSYPAQDCDVDIDDELAIGGSKPGKDGVVRLAAIDVGKVVAIDRAKRIVDVQKSKASASLHPYAVFVVDNMRGKSIPDALMRLGEEVAGGHIDSLAWKLLSRTAPRLPARNDGESASGFAVRIAPSLGAEVLPIQGPPGTGKTYTAASMIIELVRAGKRVGVTSNSHKAIRNLLDAVRVKSASVRIAHGGRDDEAPGITTIGENKDAAARIAEFDVMGGTAYMWSRPEAVRSVDVLFVDEAGQMALANVVASAAAATTLVLLGDPQQLEQPTKASHPDGTAVSSLEHLFGGAHTVSADKGIFLDVTWRLCEEICAFTSELFYDSALTTCVPQQSVRDCGPFASGLYALEVTHRGNRNSSDEEIDVIANVVKKLELPLHDIMIIAPYNAQVSRLKARLPGYDIGTVDLFQGREAKVVIFSLASSSAAEAPRGMDFLFSANRLNVATSRARAVCIMVASPDLFVAECRTPEQMKLVNAFCRYRELATNVTMSTLGFP